MIFINTKRVHFYIYKSGILSSPLQIPQFDGLEIERYLTLFKSLQNLFPFPSKITSKNIKSKFSIQFNLVIFFKRLVNMKLGFLVIIYKPIIHLINI